MRRRLWLACLLFGRAVDTFTLAPRRRLPSLLFASTQSDGRRKESKQRSNRKRPKGKRPYAQKEPVSRQVLTDYAEHRNDAINDQRLTAAIDCPHFEKCPGCVINDQVSNVDIIKSAKVFFSSTAVRKRRLDVPPDQSVVEESDDGFYQVIVPSPVKGWRTQAKLAVAPKTSSWAKDGCSFGLFRRGTHSVLSIPDCKVHDPAINKAVHALVIATEKVGTAAFEPDSSQGGLRYVQFQVERTTGKICLTLVWYAETLKETQPSLSRLVKEIQKLEPDLWHSMWVHCNDGTGNNIFSRNPNRWHRLVGPEFLREPLPIGDKGWLYFSPLTFRQANMGGFDILAQDVARKVPAKSRVCELYAGIGVLGLTALVYHDDLQQPLTWVRCSDENPANSKCFQRSINSLPLDVVGRTNESKKKDEGMTLGEIIAQMESSGGTLPGTERQGEKTSYLVATAAAALKAGQALGANVMIVDPPRRGLEDEVLDELCKPFNLLQDYVESTTVLTTPDKRVNWTNDVKTLIYVSCGFDALARDTERLLSSRGGWMLESATGYVLFPGSDHVETLAVFQRELR